MSELEILGFAQSNYVRSVRLLCEEKGVAYTLTPARPGSPEINGISPVGQIPCMRHGDITMFESLAIAVYIDKAFPGPKFIPEDAVGSARVIQWTSYGNVKVDRWIMREFVVPTVFADKIKGPDTAKIAASVPEIDKCLSILDAAIVKNGYLAGASLTFADMNVLPMLATLQRFPEGEKLIAKHSAVSRYIATLTARPSYINTTPPPPKSA